MVVTGFFAQCYTPKAVVIDNHLPRQPLISSYVPDCYGTCYGGIVSPLRRSVAQCIHAYKTMAGGQYKEVHAPLYTRL